MHETASSIFELYLFLSVYMELTRGIRIFKEHVKSCQHLFSVAIYKTVCHCPGKSDIWPPLSSFCRGHWISGISYAHTCNYILCGHVFVPKCCRLILPRAFIIIRNYFMCHFLNYYIDWTHACFCAFRISTCSSVFLRFNEDIMA